MAKKKCENESDFLPSSHIVYKTLENYFSILYSQTCLCKDTSVQR